MADKATKPAQRCTATIEGPKVGRLVMWRKPCKNRTRHPSGKCHIHRLK